MKDFTYFRIVLLVTFIAVNSECRRLKRQDLIPFPRVGKRFLLGDAADQAKMDVSDILEENQPELLEDFNGRSWLKSHSNPETKDEEPQYNGSDDVLPSQRKLFENMKESSGLSRRQSHNTKSLSIKPRHDISLRQQRTSHTPLETSTFFKYLLFHRLVWLLDTQDFPEMVPDLKDQLRL